MASTSTSLPCHSPAGTAAAAPCACTTQQVSSSGRRCQRLPVLPQHVLRVGERMDDEAGEDLRADRVQPELERRDDAEIAAAAADRPEQVGVLRLARAHAARRRP